MRFKPSIEEIGAVLKDISGLFSKDLSIERIDFVLVGYRERHGGKQRWGLEALVASVLVRSYDEGPKVRGVEL